MTDLERAQRYFENDRFAASAGIVIDAVNEEGATCHIDLGPGHKNAEGFAQGGLLYTLIDFTFAVASNAQGVSVVTLASSVNYFRPVSGGRVTATARAKSKGRTIRVYEVELTDGDGRLVAGATMTGYAREKA